MKKFFAIALALVMLVAVFAIPTSAKAEDAQRPLDAYEMLMGIELSHFSMMIRGSGMKATAPLPSTGTTWALTARCLQFVSRPFMFLLIRPSLKAKRSPSTGCW